MKKGRTQRATGPNQLSQEQLSRCSGGMQGFGPGQFTGELRKTAQGRANLQAYEDNAARADLGLGTFIEGAFEHNAKKAFGGLAMTAANVIPSGRIMGSVGTTVKTVLSATKSAAKGASQALNRR